MGERLCSRKNRSMARRCVIVCCCLISLIGIMMYVSNTKVYPSQHYRDIQRITKNEHESVKSTQTVSEQSMNRNTSKESCYLNFSIADIESKRKYFDEERIKDNSIFAFYVYLEADSNLIDYKKYLSEEIKWNGLQEWIWLKRDYRYQVLKFPVDLDSLTFTLSKYGTRNLKVSWTLSNYCDVNNKIDYENEKLNIVNFLWSNIFQNITDTEICHRTFDHNTGLLKDIWIATTVWLGYDYDCYSVGFLMSGDTKSVTISKFTLQILLVFAVGLLGYMHPFLCHVLESMQLRTDTQLNCYYEHNVNDENPYGTVRIFQKLLFSPWAKQTKLTDLEWQIKYAPVGRYYFYLTLFVFSLNLYKLLDVNNELFEDNGYENFPEVYLFGVPEYQSKENKRSFNIVLIILSAIIYFISNVYIYKMYNDLKEDFIICIPKNIFCSKWFIPINEIMNVETDETKKNASDDWILNTGTKLIHRFTMLFLVDFWRFVFTYSMCCINDCSCGSCQDRCCKNDCCCGSCPERCRYFLKCLIYLFHILYGFIIFCFNVGINIIFCSFPAIWFIVFMFINICFPERSCRCCCLSGKDCSCSKLECCPEEWCPDECSSSEFCCKKFVEVIIFGLYTASVRYQVGCFIFIIRSFFYIIIYGITGPEHLSRIYIISITSFMYFASYFRKFLGSYKVIVKTIFEIQENRAANEPPGQKKEAANEPRDQKKEASNEPSDQKKGAINTHSYQGTIIMNYSKTGQDMKGTFIVKSSSQNKEATQSIDEDLFNYIVDRCYSVKKRFFILVLKTVLTVVFLSVALTVLNDSNRLDATKNLNDYLTYLVVLISPKVVSIFSKKYTGAESKKHKSEVENLYDEYMYKKNHPSASQKVQPPYEGDMYYKELKEGCSCCQGTCCCQNCCCCSNSLCVFLGRCLCDYCQIFADETDMLSLSNVQKPKNDDSSIQSTSQNEYPSRENIDKATPKHTDKGHSTPVTGEHGEGTSLLSNSKS